MNHIDCIENFEQEIAQDDNQLNDKLINDNKFSSRLVESKFDQDDWTAAEKKISEFELSVLECLAKLGKNDTSITETELLPVAGEDIYKNSRSILYKWEHASLLVNKPKKNNKKQKQKHLKKADQIRLQNAFDKYNAQLNTLLKTFGRDELNTSYGFGPTKIVELIGVTFMYNAWFILAHPEKYTKKSKLIDVYEVIVAIQKFINSCKIYEGKSMYNSTFNQKVSETMIEDLEQWLNELITEYDFDGFKVYDIAPRLFVYTNYDQYIPYRGVKPRKNQVDLINSLRNNIINNPNDGILIILKAMIGSGKTYSVVAIINLLRTIREKLKHQGNKNLPELIFCCNLQSVKNQVSNIAYNAGIKFGVAYMRYDSVRIVNHYTCKLNSDRELIICSPNVAEKLLSDDFERMKKEKSDNKYWLFLDEPTIGADQFGSDSLKKNVSVMMNMPKYTILSSATMPEFNYINGLIELHKKKFPNVHLDTIYSNEIQIGCDVKSHNNEMILPHLGCKNNIDLKNTIEIIEQNPFLGRMYTYKVVRQLWNDLSKHTKNVPNLKEMFKDVNNLSSDKVRLEAMNMLKTLSTLDDDIIEELCSMHFIEKLKNLSFDDIEETNKSQIVFGDDTEDIENSDVKYECLGTYQAYRFPNMSLIATQDPIGFCIKNFDSLLVKLRENGIESSGRIIEKYKKEIKDYEKIHEKIIEKMQKYNGANTSDINYALKSNMNDFKDNFQSKRRDVMDVYDDKVNRAEVSGKIFVDENSSLQVQQLEQFRKPSIKFPSWAQINTFDHIKMFAKSHLKKINPRLIRSNYPVEYLPLDVSVPDEVMLLLMCGVGIYSPSNKLLDDKYTKFILEMASGGTLSYLVADDAICYGTNYPINRVFVTDEFAKSHSINTLFQLMGRAGRVGQSWIAESYIGSNTANQILQFSHEPNNSTALIEANNIQKTINEHLHIINQQEEKQKILYEQRKLEEEQHKLEMEKKKQEEFRKLELQKKLEEEKRKRTDNVYSISSIINSQKRTYSPQINKADSDNNWRVKKTTPNKEKQSDNNYIPPFAKKKEQTESNGWKTVTNKRSFKN